MSAVPKRFESILLPKLNLYFSKHLFLQPHGFCSYRSTMTNLMCNGNFLVNALEESYQVDSIYRSISKAFDSANHIILVKKLELI